MNVLQSVVGFFASNGAFLSTVGALTVIYLTLKAVLGVWRGIKVYLLARSFGVGHNLKSFGSWAVVTGSTDGIGRAYAEQLARQGLHIVLISRSPEKLASVAQEIETQSNVKTKCIAVDFTNGWEISKTIEEGLKDLDIAILVNNVGMSVDHPMYLTESTDKVLENIITVNCNSVTMMSKLVLPAMVAKRKGVIVNISSMSGVRCVPLIAVYSGTKAYVEFFSEALTEEYRSKGVIVQCIAPGFVATKMSRIRKATLIAPYPDSYVKSALATIGIVDHSFGCLVHGIQGFFIRNVPSWLYFKAIASVMYSARAQALKKRQKTQ